MMEFQSLAASMPSRHGWSLLPLSTSEAHVDLSTDGSVYWISFWDPLAAVMRNKTDEHLFVEELFEPVPERGVPLVD